MMTDLPKKRFEDHALQRIASVTNSNEQERLLALELLEARHALTQIRDLPQEYLNSQDWKNCAARMQDISQFATLPER
jgi:hypothetical protein